MLSEAASDVPSAVCVASDLYGNTIKTTAVNVSDGIKTHLLISPNKVYHLSLMANHLFFFKNLFLFYIVVSVVVTNHKCIIYE